jgi:hypothetical protein
MRSRRLRELRIVDIDCECLPGHWIGGDYVSKVLTAVAWKFIGSEGGVEVRTHYEATPGEMAAELASVIESSDIVTGHYIRGFDLRLLNGNLLLGGFGPLSPVLAHDTKLDLTKTHGRSLSQQNLGALLGLQHPKVQVTLADWEAFNTKTPGYRDKGVERVAGDVLQNIEMRERLIELGWLGAPKLWTGISSGGSGFYHA